MSSLSPPVADLYTRALERAVARTVAYADVFDYPLRDAEVHRYLHAIRTTPDTVAAALARCARPGGPIVAREGFYTLQGREDLIDLRRTRAARAASLWPTAVRFGHVIAGLPFVRMVAVTGSLVWDNVSDEADIDYLVVTEPERLWTCRWLIAALGRAVRRRGVLLCANYMVTTRALLLAERNLYGAYELTRMTPIVGLGTYRRLRRANPWAAAFLPNATDAPRVPRADQQPSRRALARLTRLGERMLRSPLGTTLERLEMKYRIRKRSKAGMAGGEVSYAADWYKGHIRGNRQHTLIAFNERLRALEAQALVP